MAEWKIVFAPSAVEDLHEAASWLAREAPEKAEEWLRSVRRCIGTLRHQPERCSYAPENGLWGEEPLPLRQLLFRDYPSTYRILFTVSGKTVQILNVRHGARRYLHEE